MSRQYQNLETEKFAKSVHGYGSDEKASKSPAEPHAQEGEGQDHDSVVPEHGKAHEIGIKHDHAKGVHHVKSVHEDGHTHNAKFGSADEAHAHAQKMAGVGEQGEEEQAAEAASGDAKSKGASLGIGV